MGFKLLQSSLLLVVGSGKVCILVQRNAFINALALPIQGFFMELPNDRGDEDQKLLVENESWDEIAQTGSFLFNSDESSISGVIWQVSSKENVAKEFRDGKILTTIPKPWFSSTRLSYWEAVTPSGSRVQSVA
jgi:hypothetical protein